MGKLTSIRSHTQGTAKATPAVANLSPAAIKAFIRIAEAWGLDEKSQLILLGSPSRTTFYSWKRTPENAKLGHDTLERISYILGIYKSLQILLPDPASADGWIQRPNTARPFEGKSALDMMTAGNVSDLYEVNRYLAAQRGW